MKFNHILRASLFAAIALTASAQTVPVANSSLAALAALAPGGAATPTVAAAPTPVSGGSAQAVAPKKPGVIRIGIALPNYNLGAPSGTSAGEPIRSVEGQLLAGPKTEVVNISSMLPLQQTAEAKLLDCDYVLTSSVAQKAKTGGFGLKSLSSFAPVANMINMVPGSSIAAGVARTMVATTALQTLSVAALASEQVKARSEVTFEYSLNSIEGKSLLQDLQKAKPKTDGEDVITPMIQQAATNIVKLLNK